MHSTEIQTFASVYGPVKSWRFGRSLGIDPIGSISTCSFNCVYCQLGTIEHQSCDRQVFVSTQQIEADLQFFTPWDVDLITLSGSGEPTLALNLGEILTMIKAVTGKPVAVLTNGSLLADPAVQAELAIADRVSVKVDALGSHQFQCINRPTANIDLDQLWAGLQQFRQLYSGHLAIQTMLLSAWSDLDQASYIAFMHALLPDEIQLNTPTRPKPIDHLNHPIAARGNHLGDCSHSLKWLKPVNVEALKAFSDRIQSTIGIPVRYPHPLYFNQ